MHHQFLLIVMGRNGAFLFFHLRRQQRIRERIKNEMNYDEEIAFQVTRQSFMMTTDGEPFKNEF